MERTRGTPVRLLCLFALVLLLAGCTEPRAPPEVRDDPAPEAKLAALYTRLAASPELAFETDHGPIRLILYTELMPETAGRFAALTESGFYDDTLIHRVVDDFVIQGGDPSKTGLVGSGETIPHETHPDLVFGSGAMGLARDIDPDSGDSQWFITEKPAPHLSDPGRSTTGSAFGAFALYAQVIEGMEQVRSLAAVPVVPGLDRPVEDLYLRTARLLPPPTDVDLLHHPPTLRLEDDAHLERPLHLLAGHPFPVTVFVPPQDDAAPPQEVTVQYGPVDEEQSGASYVVHGETFPLSPLPDDPWVFHGTATVPAAGTWHEVLLIDGQGPAETVQVHPWHDDYARFTGTSD